MCASIAPPYVAKSCTSLRMTAATRFYLMCKSSGGNEVVKHQGTGALGGWFGRFGLRGRSIREAQLSFGQGGRLFYFTFLFFVVSFGHLFCLIKKKSWLCIWAHFRSR